MRSAKIPFLLLSVSLLGCTHVNMYPICFYDNKPDPENLPTEYKKEISDSFLKISKINSEDIQMTPDVRWIIANTTQQQDKRLLKMWPRVACIGSAGSTSKVKLQDDCINYIKDFITNKKYNEIGKFKGVSGDFYNESRDKRRLVYCAK